MSNNFALIEKPNLTGDTPQEIWKKVAGLLKAGEIRLKDIASFTDYSTTTISQIFSGNYPDAKKFEDGIVRFYRSWLSKSAVVQTELIQEVSVTMEMAHRRNIIGVIIAGYGYGKSKAVTYYCALNDNAIYIELLATTSPKSLLVAIAEKLGVKGSLSGGQDEYLRVVISELNRRAATKKSVLLVIDEADRLTLKTLALLKDIYGPESDDRCGIMLVGTQKLLNLLRAADLGYLNSRITIASKPGMFSKEEAIQIMKLWPIDFDREDFDKAYAWASAHFAIRSLVAIMARSYDAMQIGKKKQIDSACLERGIAWLVK